MDTLGLGSNPPWDLQLACRTVLEARANGIGCYQDRGALLEVMNSPTFADLVLQFTTGRAVVIHQTREQGQPAIVWMTTPAGVGPFHLPPSAID